VVEARNGRCLEPCRMRASTVASSASLLLPDSAVLTAAVCVKLEELPDELLAAIMHQLSDNDYNMLTLPLVSTSFRRACALPAVEATRIASRLRQVVHGVVLPASASAGGGSEVDEWSLGHIWGALQMVQGYLGGHCTERLRYLAAAPEGLDSLKSLVVHCRAFKQSVLPTPVSAEVLFHEAETSRLQLSPSSLTTAQRADNSAMLDAAAAINLKAEASQRALKVEMERQRRRQLAATCRRNWKMLTAAARRGWEQRAAVEGEQALRRHEGSRMAAALAAKLSVQIAAAESDGWQHDSVACAEHASCAEQARARPSHSGTGEAVRKNAW